VEDDEPSAYLIKRAFAERTAKVEWDLCFAKDGQDALECLHANGTAQENGPPPDLVLLDWNLPKVSGGEVLRALKTSEQLRTVPVLVFSASQEETDIRDAYNGHANGFIPKPSDIEDLYAVIENIENFWVHTVRLLSRQSGGPVSPTKI